MEQTVANQACRTMQFLHVRLKSQKAYREAHNKVIRGFQAFRQARASVTGLEPAIEERLPISGRVRYPPTSRLQFRFGTQF
ncbi:hypothetical protein PoB_001511700 [Plakobranchus ocellatus]|uniref:Uncharacterized protein n=1 Tax=Plakobranchus ocellatus TaxID=259542 RepID=A0AAV3Z291_9GAST|nr:hypothetical protein PoB_001511700 [Plakobranchus ocellatus]